MDRNSLLRRTAFTLIELMVVIVIIGILAGIIVPNYVGRTEPAYDTRVKADMKSISDALEFFKMDTGNYPESLEELYTGSSAEGWRGPYLKSQMKDPWGNDYIYEHTGESGAPFILRCYGRDGAAGGEGEDKDYSNVDELQGTGGW